MTRSQFDESQLRHPLERPIFIASVIVNLAIMVAAVVLVSLGGDWLDSHPILKSFSKQMRALAMVAVFAPPAIAVIRNIRRGLVRGNSVRLSREQVPEIYEILERHCDKLGLATVPELYLADRAVPAPALAFSTWQHDCVGINARYIERKLKASRLVLAFLLGRELGRIRLGHTKWWYEMVLSYVIRIPYLRNPMMQVQEFSHDRYGAFLESEGLPGLVIQASGRRLLKQIDEREFLKRTSEYGGFWAVVSNFANTMPHVSYRIKALLKAGLLTVDSGTEEAAVPDEPAEHKHKHEDKAKDEADSRLADNPLKPALTAEAAPTRNNEPGT
jgi:hypothetical protein